MDQSTQTQPQPQPSVPQPVLQIPNAQKKNNMVGIFIVVLILAASIITAGVYFLLPQKKQGQQANTDQTTNTDTNTEAQAKTPWTTYTDEQSGYIFHYPQTWKLEIDKKNPEKFVLREDSGEPGEIQGEFIPKERFSKEAVVTCDPQVLAEVMPGQANCLVYEKTTASSAYVFPTIDANNKITIATAYVTRPGGAGFSFKITKSNTDSYDVFSNIIDTLQFPNEKRSAPLLICPDSWSADRKTVTYHGISFPASDIESTCK